MASYSKVSPLKKTVNKEGKDLGESELRWKHCFHTAAKGCTIQSSPKLVPIEAFQKQPTAIQGVPALLHGFIKTQWILTTTLWVKYNAVMQWTFVFPSLAPISPFWRAPNFDWGSIHCLRSAHLFGWGSILSCRRYSM